MSVIKALLMKGAPIDARTKDSYTALHVAVEYGKPLAVQSLLGNGAQVRLESWWLLDVLHVVADVYAR